MTMSMVESCEKDWTSKRMRLVGLKNLTFKLPSIFQRTTPSGGSGPKSGFLKNKTRALTTKMPGNFRRNKQPATRMLAYTRKQQIV